MASQLRQFKRLFYLETPLGEDALLVKSLRGREGLSDLFRFDLELLSEDPYLAIQTIVGKPVTLGIRQSDGETLRYFNGYIARAQAAGSQGRLAAYRATVVPWLWFLTCANDCFIHQDKPVTDIIEEIFKKYGFTDYKPDWRHGGDYNPWEYCTQYRESAFNFVSRLMEIEGLYYYFHQQQGKHTMVITDDPGAHQRCEYQARFKLERAFGRGYFRTEDTIFRWDCEKQFRVGKFTLRDYNFKQPDADLTAQESGRSRQAGSAKYEVYDYPGEYEKHNEGSAWVRTRMEEEEIDEEVMRGTSNARSLMPGFRFDLTGHERREQNRNYLVTSLIHEGNEENFLPDEAPMPPHYGNSFTCIPSQLPYKAPRKTPKHIMRGVQTAVVVGPKGEEIYCDKYGRVKVQFHWDREGKKDQSSSCWMRVSQPWAGKNWGSMFLPRIGQEVIVDYIEGDPDRPIITGRVYNANQMPVWELPTNMNWSGFKTRSTKGGGPDNYNELRWDDTKGKELYLMHAERDMQITVEHDTIEHVMHDRCLTVDDIQSEEVKKDSHSHVGGDRTENTDGKWSVSVGGEAHLKSGQVFTLESGTEIHLKAGTRIVLEAGMGISLKGSGGFIDIGPGGIDIEGTLVRINCGGGSPAEGTPSLPSRPISPASLLGAAAGALGGAAAGAAGAAGALGGAAAGALGGAAGTMAGAMGDVTGAAGGALAGAAGSAAGSLGGLATQAGGALSGAAGQLAQPAQQAYGQVAQGVEQGMQQMGQAAGGLIGQAEQAAQQAGHAASDVIGQAEQGAQEVAQAAMGALQDAAQELGQTERDAQQAASEALDRARQQVEQFVDEGPSGPGRPESNPFGPQPDDQGWDD